MMRFVCAFSLALACAPTAGNDRLNGLLAHYVQPHVRTRPDGTRVSVPAHYHRCEAGCPLCNPPAPPRSQQPADEKPSVYANPSGAAPPASTAPAAPSCEAKCQAQFTQLQERLDAIGKNVEAAGKLADGNRGILGRLEGEVTSAHLRIDEIAQQKPGTTIVQATREDVQALIAPELDRRDEALRGLVQKSLAGQTCTPAPQRSWLLDLALAAAPATPYGAGIAVAGSALAWMWRRRRQRRADNAGAEEAPAPIPFP